MSNKFNWLTCFLLFMGFVSCTVLPDSNEEKTQESTIEANAVAPVIKIQTCQNGAVVQNQISERITLVNNSSSAVGLSTVKVRYYFAYQGSKTYNFACDYSPIGSGNVSAVFVALSPVYPGAEAYEEISFSAGAGSLAAGASVELQCRIWKSDWSNIDNALNYSYNPSTSYTDWNKVTAFVSGTQVWGTAPGGTTSTSSTSVVSSSSRSSSSVTGTAKAVPGQIEAENYDTMTGIKTENCAEGTLNVGWTDAGDSLNYYINVTQAGLITIEARLASLTGGGKYQYLLDGKLLSAVTVPNTGGWQKWTSVKTLVAMPAGNHTLKIQVLTGGFNINWFKTTAGSSVSYSPGDVVTTQTGWKPNSPKHIVLSLSASIPEPDYTLYLNNQIVNNGKLTFKGNFWSQYHYSADISTQTGLGTYTLIVNGYAPNTFEVRNDVYVKLTANSGTIRMNDFQQGFWVYQRSYANSGSIGGVYTSRPVSTNQRYQDDARLPIYMAAANSVETATGGYSSDLNGGWYDATSTDKETANEGKALASLCMALESLTDGADRAAILKEVSWGASYLVHIQNPDGSFPLAVKPWDYWVENAPPLRVLMNKGSNVNAKVVVGLINAYMQLKNSDVNLANSCLTAARKAYSWMSANMSNFIPDTVYPNYWVGSAGVYVAAAVEMARATGESTYINDATSLIAQGQFSGGIWKKITGTFPAQTGWDANEATEAQTALYLSRFYSIADATTKSRINTLINDYLNYWFPRQNAAYGMSEGFLFSWFGINNAQTAFCEMLLHIAQNTGNRNALVHASRIYDWITGQNPFNSSFIVGVGKKWVVQPFGRDVQDSIGGVLPGILYINNSYLSTTEYGNTWESWKVGEETVDVSGVIVDVMALLQKLN